jgi:predicted aspartyl protease
MGEVKVTIKLTNNVDEVLAKRGKLRAGKIRSLELEGIVDTRAVSLTLPSHVVEKLGLTRMFKQIAQYADGRLEEVDVTEPVFVEIMGRNTSEEAMVLGDEILIGQTVPEKTDLRVDSRQRRLVPNPAHPNQPVTRLVGVRLAPRTAPSAGRRKHRA